MTLKMTCHLAIGFKTKEAIAGVTMLTQSDAYSNTPHPRPSMRHTTLYHLPEVDKISGTTVFVGLSRIHWQNVLVEAAGQLCHLDVHHYMDPI